MRAYLSILLTMSSVGVCALLGIVLELLVERNCTIKQTPNRF